MQSMSNKRLPLAELRQKLRQPPAPRRAPDTAPSLDDDAALFRAATAGARALAPDGRANIEGPRPLPNPRPRKPEPVAEASPPPTEDTWIPAAWLKPDPDAKPQSEEARVLDKALQGVQPLRQTRIELESPKPLPLPRQRQRDEEAALAESIYAPTSLDLQLEGGDELNYLANGVPRNTLRDLRRGRWVVQDAVDLHGCNRDEARELLAACMGQWRKEGVRCVRVIHGKGRGSPGREPVLKRLVAGWLMNYADVMAYCQARLVDGGAGALIVLLKASGRPTPLL